VRDPHERPRNLQEGLRGSDNAFGFLRLSLALLVLVDHAFPTGGFGKDPLWRHTLGQESFGGLAVLGFFAISGYLIAKSAQNADIMQFLWRRVVRIFPAYWVMLIVTAVVIGPLLWLSAGRPLGAYWTTSFPGPLTYFTHNWTLSIGQYSLHDLLATTTPYGRDVHASVLNGSTWTLIYEWHAYLLIGVLLISNVIARAPALVAVIAGALVVLQFIAVANPAGPGTIAKYLGDPYSITLTSAFMVGSTLAVFASRVPLDDRLGVACGITVIGTLRYGGFASFGVPLGVYFVIWLAARLPVALRRVGRKNDYSYGVYVYGFMAQQVLAYKGAQRYGYLPFLLASIAVTMVCGVLSWHIVEKPSLALKSWGPGRGIEATWNRVKRTRTPRLDSPENIVPATEIDGPAPSEDLMEPARLLESGSRVTE
jgi:peptidoglycan/LPS O-acetylase OafA/YrhL